MGTATGPDDIHLSEEQKRELREYARSTGRSESDVIAAALGEYLSLRARPAVSGENCYEVAKRIGLLGVADDLPPDLSTNPAYFEGFGRE